MQEHYRNVVLHATEEDPNRMIAGLHYGWIAADLGLWEDVRWLVDQEGLTLAQRDDLFGARYATLKGRLLAHEGALEEAESLLRQGHAAIRAVCEPELPDHRLLVEAREALASVAGPDAR